jgi:hypothetical protein
MATLSLLLGAFAPESVPLGRMTNPSPVAAVDFRKLRRLMIWVFIIFSPLLGVYLFTKKLKELILCNSAIKYKKKSEKHGDK